MATFDKLSDQQQAIVELVLRQGKSYAELAEMLDIPAGRVRELARDALVDLAPVSARRVEEDWRGQLADYLLGQQSGPEATATRGHLRRSEGARAWAVSVLDSLDHLYGDEIPQIPEPERGGLRVRPAAAAPAAGGGPAFDRGRLLAGGGVLVAALLVAVLVWPIGVLTGDDDDDDGDGASAAQQTGASQGSTRPEGRALIVRRNGKPQVIVTAQGLEPSTEGSGYQVWLYNNDRERKSLGFGAANQQGILQAGAPLPADFRDYEFIDMSSVTIEGERAKNGPSVVRGVLELRDKPVTQGKGKNRVTLLGDVKMVALPQGG